VSAAGGNIAVGGPTDRQVDPFKRPVHIVPVWDNEKRDYVETVWPGIAEHRTTAFRTSAVSRPDPNPTASTALLRR
jgi:hypothetical protein